MPAQDALAARGNQVSSKKRIESKVEMHLRIINSVFSNVADSSWPVLHRHRDFPQVTADDLSGTAGTRSSIPQTIHGPHKGDKQCSTQ
jgi:hypothetical protein